MAGVAASLGEGSDEALLAWATACLPAAEAKPSSLQELGDSVLLVGLACKFVQLPANVTSQVASERRGQLASALARVRPPVVVTVDEAKQGGPLAARGLVAAVLLSAVQGVDRLAAVSCIRSLRPAHQEVLAQVLQQLLAISTGPPSMCTSSASRRFSSPFSTPFTSSDRGSSILRGSSFEAIDSSACPSRAESFSRDPRGSMLDDGAPQEARELHEELQSYMQKAGELRRQHQINQRDLLEVKSLMYQEAETCNDLSEDLTEKLREHEEFVMHVRRVKEELNHESGIAQAEEQSLRKVQNELVEMRRHHLELESRHSRLQELWHSQKDGSDMDIPQSCGSTELLAKLRAIEDECAQKSQFIKDARNEREHTSACTLVLRAELAEAEEALQLDSEEAREMNARLYAMQDRLDMAEKELDCTSLKLQKISAGSVEDLRKELQHCEVATEQAGKAYSDAVARLKAAERRMQPVEAALQSLSTAGGDVDISFPDEAAQASPVAASSAPSPAASSSAPPAVATSSAPSPAASSSAPPAMALQLAAQASQLAAPSAPSPTARAAAHSEARAQRASVRAAAAEQRTARRGALLQEAQARHAAAHAAEVAICNAALEGAKDEVQALHKEIAACRLRQQQAAEEREAQAWQRSEAQVAAAVSQRADSEVGVQATILEFQIMLREREQAHRESAAAEIEASHQREVRLLAAALHRLGMRYGRVLGQSEAMASEDRQKEEGMQGRR